MIDKIEKLCANAGISLAELSKQIGISTTAIYKWRQGSMPRSKQIKAVADYFDVPVEYFSDDYVQTSGTIGAGYTVEASETFGDDFFKIPEKLLKGRSKDDFVYLKIHGDSMLPEYKDGDNVLILRSPAVENGKIAACIYGGETIGTLKRIYVKGSTVVLQPLNSEFEPLFISGAELESFHILGEPKLLIREYE